VYFTLVFLMYLIYSK